MRKNILLIDNDHDYIEFFENLLGNEYQICIARDLNETIEQIKDEPFYFELVICETHLENMSGFEIFNKLRNNIDFRHIPFIFKTSSKCEEIFYEAMVLNGVEIIHTNMKYFEVIARIKLAIRSAPVINLKVDESTFVMIDTISRKVIFPQVNIPIFLTESELKTLKVFDYKNDYIKKEEIIEYVYGKGYHITDNNFNTVLSNIRKKIEPLNIKIAAKRNIGLRLEALQVS